MQPYRLRRLKAGPASEVVVLSNAIDFGVFS